MEAVREVARRRLFDGFLSVDEIELEVGGKVQRRQVVERGDAVGVLLHHAERDELLLVRQLRAATLGHGDPWLVEIVAGMIDPGETPIQAARREIEEEVGYHVGGLKSLGYMYGSPGGLSERIWLYFAEVAESARVGQGGGIDDETVESVWLTPTEAYRQLDEGELPDAKTQIALLRVRSSLLATTS